jgi:hypothetical protein
MCRGLVCLMMLCGWRRSVPHFAPGLGLSCMMLQPELCMSLTRCLRMAAVAGPQGTCWPGVACSAFLFRMPDLSIATTSASHSLPGLHRGTSLGTPFHLCSLTPSRDITNLQVPMSRAAWVSMARNTACKHDVPRCPCYKLIVPSFPSPPLPTPGAAMDNGGPLTSLA